MNSTTKPVHLGVIGMCLALMASCGSDRSVLTGDFSKLGEAGDGLTVEIAYQRLNQDDVERVVLASGRVESGSIELKFIFDQEVPRVGFLAVSNQRPGEFMTSGRSILLEKGASYTMNIQNSSSLWFTLTSTGNYGRVIAQDDVVAQAAYVDEMNDLRERLQQLQQSGIRTVPLTERFEDVESESRVSSIHAEVLDWDSMNCADYAGEYENFWEKRAKFAETTVPSEEAREIRIRMRELSTNWHKKVHNKQSELLTAATDPVQRLLILELGVDLEPEKLLQIYEELATQLPEHVVEERVTKGLTWLTESIALKKVDESLKLGTYVPSFGIMIDDSDLPFQDVLKDNQIVVLEFWENYCGLCLSAFRNYRKFYEKFTEFGFEVVSISIERNREDWVQKSTELDLPWIDVFASGGRQGAIAQMFGVEFPRKNFVLDSEGCILKRDLTPNELYDFLSARLSL